MKTWWGWPWGKEEGLIARNAISIIEQVYLGGGGINVPPLYNYILNPTFPISRTLTPGNNQLKKLDNVMYLRQFRNLRLVNLAGNPFCKEHDYRRWGAG